MMMMKFNRISVRCNSSRLLKLNCTEFNYQQLKYQTIYRQFKTMNRGVVREEVGWLMGSVSGRRRSRREYSTKPEEEEEEEEEVGRKGNLLKYDKKEPTGIPLLYKVILLLGILGGGGYLGHYLLFPNIRGFPKESRELLREALWARNKEKDNYKAINLFELAIDSMKRTPEFQKDSWHLIGTILELTQLYKLTSQLNKATISYQEAIELLAPSKTYPTPTSISKTKKLSYKTKNKLVGIYLELAQLHSDQKEPELQRVCLDYAVSLILGGGKTLVSTLKADLTTTTTTTPSFHLPQWVSHQEAVACLERAADHYRTTEYPHYAIYLYQFALPLCSSPDLKAILLCNLGTTYQTLDNLEAATNSLRQALDLLEGLELTTSTKTMAAVLFNLASVLEATGDHATATSLYKKLYHSTFQPHLDPDNWSIVLSQTHPGP